MSDSATPAAFSEFKVRWLPRIENALARLATPEGTPPKLAESMRYSLLLPGKRIRPLLVLAAADICGGNPDDAMRAACAIEMIHAFSLIHDDLPAMDDDDERRGKPSNHKVFGEAHAILAGDALLVRAFELIAEYPQGGRLCKELSVAIGAAGMCGGQSDDVEGGISTLDNLLDMHAKKTGALIRAATQTGAIVAGADTQKIDALSQYGEDIGIVFQITDDLLDGEAIPEKEKAKEIAEQRTNDALQILGGFGERAEHLRDLARIVLTRTS